jgi:CRISPR-associated endonuclease Cas2
MRFWMFCYDISDNRSRRDVARTLADAGAYRVQESVFEGWFDSREIAALFAALKPLIVACDGKLRAYPRPSAAPARRAGQGGLPPAPTATRHWVC